MTGNQCSRFPGFPGVVDTLARCQKYGGPIWRTGSIFSCRKGLSDCLPTKPITTKQQSMFWLVSQSRHMLATYVGTCQWISLAVASDHPVVVVVAG